MGTEARSESEREEPQKYRDGGGLKMDEGGGLKKKRIRA